jgi:hypothetical protein
MAKTFYTDKDIEELFNNGTKALRVDDNVALTDLAYEKAKRLGLHLVFDGVESPPTAPIRPYLSDVKPRSASRQVKSDPVSQASTQPDIENRIRSAVIAKLGNQMDAKLLDNIIHRVVKATGLK